MKTTTSGPVLRTFVNAQQKRSTDVAVSEDRLADFDALAVYFAENDNREQYTMIEPTVEAAEILVKQLKQYARKYRLSTRPEQDEHNPCSVTFRFSPQREKSDEDGTDSADAVDSHVA